MSKRFKNLILMLLVPVGLVALFALMSIASGGTGTQVASAAKDPGYSPNGSWSDLPALPTVTLGFGQGQYGGEGNTPLKLKRGSAVGYPPNGMVYILGGRHRTDGDDISSPWIWQYDPGTNTYTRKNTLIDADITGDGQCPQGCYGTRASGNMAVATLSDGTNTRIYMIGGSDTNSLASNRVRVYDPVADSLTLLTSDVWPASPARIPGGYAVYNNKLYIFGGYDPTYNNVVYSDTWVFDPTAGSGAKWTHIASANLSVARSFIAGAELDGYIYAIGGDVISGVISTTVVPQTVVERMHPADANPTWQAMASLPTARGDMGVWAYDSGTGNEISGHIVVGGGKFPIPDSTSYIYDPGTNSWSNFAPLMRNRRNVAYTQFNNVLYAFGGYNITNTSGVLGYDGSNDSMKYTLASGGPTFTPTPTRTGTQPTNTPTNTAIPSTNTPSATSTTCGISSLINEGFESGLGTFSSVVGTCVPGGCGWSHASNAHTGTGDAFAPD
ncbi:MAG TPA: kelch repeat-containing protein, partial [Chloroflexia bacterium]|nr:kelch repeat-containing protein [Chloroflexia bacterium]